jgi:hypothetical protein
MKAKDNPRHADPDDPGPWLAQLHGDDDLLTPDDDFSPRPQGRVAGSYVGVPGRANDAEAGTWPAASPCHVARQPQFSTSPRPSGLAHTVTERALIGNQLRMPTVWCQMGSCVTRYADPDALGEADNQARAVAAGWREDAFGRIACPTCLQHSPQFRTKYPAVPWDKKRALAMVALMCIATRHYRDSAAEAHQARPRHLVGPGGD